MIIRMCRMRIKKKKKLKGSAKSAAPLSFKACLVMLTAVPLPVLVHYHWSHVRESSKNLLYTPRAAPNIGQTQLVTGYLS